MISCFCITLGPTCNEFGYNEHLAIARRFLDIKIIDCNVKEFGYNEQPLVMSSFSCIFYSMQAGPSIFRCVYLALYSTLSMCLTPVYVWLCVWQLPVSCVFRWRSEPHLRALPRSLRNHHHQHLPGGNNDQYLQRNRALARLSQVPREGTQGLIDYGEVLGGLWGRGPSFCIEVPIGLSGRETRVCGEVLGGLSGRVPGCVRETPGILSMLRGIPGIYHIPRRLGSHIPVPTLHESRGHWTPGG